MWQVIAQGTPAQFEAATPTVPDLPSGTPVLLEIETTVPVAPLFDLWGMDWVAEQMWASGVDVTEVHSVGWNKVVIYGTVYSPVVPIIIAIAVVLAIGGVWFIVRELRLLANVVGPVTVNLMAIAGIAVAAFLGYAIYTSQRKVRAP